MIHGPDSPQAIRERLEETAPPPPETAPLPQPTESNSASQPLSANPDEGPATSADEQRPEPEDKTTPETPPPATAKDKPGISLLWVFLLAFLLSALFFSLGFVFGKRGGQASTPPPPPATAPPELTPAEAAPADAREIPIPAIEPSPTPENETVTNSARAALVAFLEASSWAVRNAYVTKPDEALSDMEKMAQTYGDGSIPFEDIALAFDNGDEQVFQLLTPKDEKPFLVSVMKDGPLWHVDWETFSEFYYDRFETFAQKNSGSDTGVFRLRLKPAPGEADPLTPSRVLAQAPNSNQSFQLTFGTSSEAREKVASLLAILKRDQPELLDKMMASDGIPLVVRVSRTGATNPELRLEEVVATSWSQRQR